MNTLIALVVPAAVLLAYAAGAGATPRSRRRDADRRARRVARHPGLANLGDVHRRLAADLPDAHRDFAMDRVVRHRVDARTLWTWLDRFGAEALVLALAAGHGYADLLRILVRGTFDIDEARVLAELSEPALFAPVRA